MRLRFAVFIPVLLLGSCAVSPEARWQRLTAAGEQAATSREKTEAKEKFTEALKLAEKQFGRKDLRYVVSLVNLADAEVQTFDYGTAEQHYKRAERLLLPQPNGAALMIRTREHLAEILSKLGRDDEVAQVYMRLMRTAELKEGPNSPEVAKRLTEMAQVYRFHRNLEKARPLYEHALKILESSPDADPALLATTLMQLAFIYRQAGDCEEAAVMYTRGAQAWAKVPGHAGSGGKAPSAEEWLKGCKAAKQDQRLPGHSPHRRKP